METKYMGFGHGDLSLVGSYVRQGKIVAFPTDVMYVMGANALNDNAVERIFTVKGCSMDSPLIVHVWNKHQIGDFARLNADAEKVVDKLMPANITLLLPKKETLSSYVTGRLKSVAVRMPQNNEARKFLQYAEVPVATTGASLVGHANPTSWRKVKAELGGNISAIMCGDDTQSKEESTIIDFTGKEPIVLRQGQVSIEAISNVLEKPVEEVSDVEQLVTVMGGKLKNYRSKKVQMVLHVGGSVTKMCAYYDGLVEQGYNPVLLAQDVTQFGKRNVYSFGDDPSDMAFRLFDCLRILETRYNFIIACVDSETSSAYNILNSLIRTKGAD